MPAAATRRMFVLVLAFAFVLALSLALTLSPSVRAGGASFTVDSTADASDENPGDTLCETMVGDCTLRAAIEESNALAGPNVITVPAATYVLVNGALSTTESVTITGTAGAATTILDGGGTQRIFFLWKDGPTSAPVVNISGLTMRDGSIDDMDGGAIRVAAGTLNLADSVVTGSTALPSASDAHGGGIFVATGASAVLSGTTVSENEAEFGAGIFVSPNASLAVESSSIITGNGTGASAAWAGGGIYSNGGTVTVSGSTVSANRAFEGGGISSASGSVTLTESSLVTGNLAVASTGFNGHGGGIHNTGALNISDSTISDNAADGNGGGIYTEMFTDVPLADISGSTISGNVADNGGGIYHRYQGGAGVEITGSTIGGAGADENDARADGGGIWSNGEMSLHSTTVSGNSAVARGGGMFVDANGASTVTESAITGNAADVDGGGIYDLGEVRLQNATVSGNSAAGDGGGIFTDGGLAVRFSTIAENTAVGGFGGGIYLEAGAFTDFYGSIMSGGAPDDCFNNDGSFDSLGSNIDSDGSCELDAGPSDQPNTDPLLEPLADNGGSTLTHALTTDSPAIDAVAPAVVLTRAEFVLAGAFVTTCPATDQRGVDRPQDGDGDGVPVCDIGAFELEPAAASIDDVTVTEGDAGTVDAVFTVTLSRASSETVTYAYATTDDTATAGSDYDAAAGTVTFAPGDTSETITVSVRGDTTDEPNETFEVNLTALVGGTLADAQGIGTILDDEGPIVTPSPTGGELPDTSTNARGVGAGAVPVLPSLALLVAVISAAVIGARAGRRRERA